MCILPDKDGKFQLEFLYTWKVHGILEGVFSKRSIICLEYLFRKYGLLVSIQKGHAACQNRADLLE